MRIEKIVIVDYGLGNLFSVQRALEHCGASNVCISSTIDDVIRADRLILPGVGAFGDGVRNLTSLGLVQPIRSHASNKKPMLGICVGMQLLATTSEEFGTHHGLNLIPGKVLPISNEYPEGVPRKVPFIGWGKLSSVGKQDSTNKLLNELSRNKSVYFLHSFRYYPDDLEHLIASYEYQGDTIAAAIRSDNIYGFQFHVEKSGEVGLNLLQAFLNV